MAIALLGTVIAVAPIAGAATVVVEEYMLYERFAPRLRVITAGPAGAAVSNFLIYSAAGEMEFSVHHPRSLFVLEESELSGFQDLYEEEVV